MKLLYIWIEEFRNIHHQGIVIDDEYLIQVSNPQNPLFNYCLPDGSRIHFAKGAKKSGIKIFERRIEWIKNERYTLGNKVSAINSIAALVGKNATGKSSILECISTLEHAYYEEDVRHYFLVFLNQAKHCIEIRSKGIRITSENTMLQDSPKYNNYEIYILPLEDHKPVYPCVPDDQTQFFFLAPQKQPTAYLGYMVLGLPTIVCDLDAYTNLNAFEGAFDFLCNFPELVSPDNKLVAFLRSVDRNQRSDYFETPDLTCSQYKDLFIRRLAQIVFSNLRTYLYHSIRYNKLRKLNRG